MILNTLKNGFLLVVLTGLAACSSLPEEATDAGPGEAQAVSQLDQADAAPAVPEPPAAPEPTPLPTDPDIMFHVLAAEVLGKDGDVRRAVDHYLEAAMLSRDPAIAERTTRICIQARLWEQAVLAADRWALLSDNRPAALEAAIHSRLQVLDYAGASAHLDTLFEQYEDDSAAWASVAGLLARSPDPQQALALLHEFIERHGGDSSAALLAQSQLAARLGDRELAIRLANQAISLEPENLELRAWAGRLALAEGEDQAAMLHFAVANELDPQNVEIAAAYAELLNRAGQPDQAQAVLAALPATPPVYMTRILYATQVDDQALAEELYQELLAMTDAPDRAFYAAQSAELLERPELAIEWYNKVPRGDSGGDDQWLNARLRMAVLKAEHENLESGRRVLAELQGESNGSVVEQAFMTESQLLQQYGEDQAAIQVLTKGMTKLKQSTALRYNRALLYANAGEVPEAEGDLRFLLQNNPNNADAMNALGYTLTDLTDRHEEAYVYIVRALELKPGDPAIIDSMGWVLYRLGRLEDSRRFLEQALSIADNAEIAAHLGEVLWAMEQHDQARQVLRTAYQSDPDNSVLRDTAQRLGVEL